MDYRHKYWGLVSSGRADRLYDNCREPEICDRNRTGANNTEGTLDKAELKLKLADLMVDLANARTQTSDMQEAMDHLADELRTAEKKLAFAGSMKYEAPYYVNVGAGDRGPYCGTCWDAERLAIHLIERQRGFWYCKRCDELVEDSTAENPPSVDPSRE
jgi:hypothetical protein